MTIWNAPLVGLLEKAGTYNESKHPRKPRGAKGGGQFAPKGGQTIAELDSFLGGEESVIPSKQRGFSRDPFDSSEYAESLMALSAQEKKAYEKLFEGYFAAIGSTPEDSVPLEYLVSRKFGGKIFNYDGEVPPEDGEKALRKVKIDPAIGKSVVSKQYRVTQKYLQQKYGKNGHVTLYRGVRGKDAVVKNGKMQIELDALSSWTTDKMAARRYASYHKDGGKLLAMSVPIRDIFVTDFTSVMLADNGENEFSVLGRGRRVWVPAQNIKHERPRF